MSVRLCVNRRCRRDEGPRETHDPYRLCRPCSDRLVRWIEQMPTLHGWLIEALDRRPHTAGGATPDDDSGGHPGLRMPWAGNAVVLADLHAGAAVMLGVVQSWARVVMEDRGLRGPGRPGDIRSVCGFLAASVDWLAQQPFADEVMAEIGEVRAKAWRAVDNQDVAKWLPCVGYLDDHPCPGQLRVTSASTDAHCDTCGRHEPDLHWYGRQLRGDEPAQVDAYAASHRLVALGYDVTPRQIARWVEKGLIAAVGRDAAKPKPRNLYDYDNLLLFVREHVGTNHLRSA